MDTFQAIADPNRRQILELLAKNGQLSSSAISAKFSVSAPAISQHLKVLREARLVKMEKRAQQHIYQLNPKKIEEIDFWVKKLKQVWDTRMDRLDLILADMKKESKEKTCSRGHKFTGSGPCPICWPGRLKKGKLSS